ncbi:adenylyl-sulfate kinase [Mesohalobacter halotolerans]|uniref:Adenylyl-sulfate kinase n=1 Tax=Mesohalobacter halotolerans TaxID=1883405 RepID=A0A4U5TRY8_9FLAO|nr:adenylyl-sulfate kinase [Mesohalobacter halotolerans]MBS3737457.1 adenylyl-sulfate kinase [Psychroflexus sp.]TKS57039.1 adenylyl-sulfate kinase [Mesohalobacter halotolerans]
MNNTVFHNYHITRKDREKQLKQPGMVLWFTGLSGSGKSTIANAVEQDLFHSGYKTYTLDGDNIRQGINRGLGFTAEDRAENLRRIAEVAKLFVDAGQICIAAFVSPTKADRKLVKDIIGEDDFIEIFVDTPLEICEKRDVKGLYAKARKGEIKNFTGISAPYENPEHPDLIIKTEHKNVGQSAKAVTECIKSHLKSKNYE